MLTQFFVTGCAFPEPIYVPSQLKINPGDCETLNRGQIVRLPCLLRQVEAVDWSHV